MDGRNRLRLRYRYGENIRGYQNHKVFAHNQ